MNGKRQAKLLHWVLGLAGFLAASRPLPAYFVPAGFGVRPAGMGEAFVSVADDANALLFNPAGCAQISRLELTGMYSDLYSHLNARLYDGRLDRAGYNFLALAAPVDPLRGGVGISWLQFQSVLYQENTLTAAYARNLLAQPLWGWDLQLDAGLSLKALQWRVAANEFTADAAYYPYSELQKWGFTGDLGLLLTLQKNIRLALSGENLIPADMGITLTEYVPAVWRAGASYFWRLASPYVDSLLAAFELDARNDLSNSIYNPKFGIETWFLHHLLALRAGVNLNQATTGMSFDYQWPGAYIGIRLDYAFAYPLHVLDTWGSHRVGAVLHWDYQEYLSQAALAREQEAAAARAAREKSALQAAAAAEAARTALLAEVDKSIQEAAASVQNAIKSCNYAKEAVRKSTQIAREALTQPSSVAGDETRRAIAQAEKLAGRAADTAQLADQQCRLASQAGENLKQESAAAALQPLAAAAREAAGQAVKLSDESSQAAFSAIEMARKTEYARYFLPEKQVDRIVIGVDQQIADEFGDQNELSRIREILGKYLKTRVKLPLEIRAYRLTDLEFAFINGEVDVVVSSAAFFQPYYQRGMIKPLLTVSTHGRDSQRCLLLARADSGLTRPDQLQHKRISYTRREVLPKLKEYFFARDPGYSAPGNYFGSLDMRKNALDSLLALQLKSADAIIEFEYILNIYNKMKNDMPDIKVIAASPWVPNAPAFQKISKSKAKNRELNRLRTALLGFRTQSEAAEIFGFFDIDGFVPYRRNR